MAALENLKRMSTKPDLVWRIKGMTVLKLTCDEIVISVLMSFLSFEEELAKLLTSIGDNEEKRESLFAAVKALKKTSKET